MRLRPKRLFPEVNSRLSGAALAKLVLQLQGHGIRIDLVHGHFASGSVGLPFLKARLGIPYVVSEHSSALTRFNPEKETSKSGVRRAQAVYQEAAAVLPVSRYLEQEILQKGLRGNFKVVPNPVDTEVFRPRGLPRQPRIISVGRLVRVKRQEILIRAAAQTARTVPELRLDIVGDGPERGRLERLVDELSIRRVVTFHGGLERSRIPDLLAGSSVFAMSSFTENLPVAMIEALACGLPVIGPSVGGIPEIVNGSPGGLFEPGDVDGLASLLFEWALPSEAVRAAAREVAVSRYSIPVVAQKLAEIYRAALATQ